MKHLDSKELLSRTKTLVTEERRTTLALIEHLEEIQRRMLYAELGYGSLWEFATRYLGLSEGAAQRRIQAMRLVRDVPEAKPALASGILSLSNAAKVQSFFQTEKKQGRPLIKQEIPVTQQDDSISKQDQPTAWQNHPITKLDVLRQISGLSQKECEQVLHKISPQAIPQEHERIVSAQADRELKFVVSAELYDKLMRLKALLSQALPDATYAQLLEHMTEEVLTRQEKKKGIIPRETSALTEALTAAAAVEAKRPLPSGLRVALPAAVRRAVWARGRGQCEITVNGHRCQARFRLEIDHVIPLALGGAKLQLPESPPKP